MTLVGASIGQDWDLPGLPARTSAVGYQFEALQAWQFDKSEVLDEVLSRPERKFKFTRTYFLGFLKPAPRSPDVIVIKECSSYFPEDHSYAQKQKLVEHWVRQIRAAQIVPILATAVPVTKERAARDPGKQEALTKFNDWIRDYARRNRIVLLDLEEATRTTDDERYLRTAFAVADGSHLNRKAYDVLDHRMLQAVCAAKRATACK